MNRFLLSIFFFPSLIFSLSVSATIYDLPQQGDLIGEVSTISAKEEDTLLEIAIKHNLGYNEIIAANPDVDPWLPGEGTEVLIPSRYILPDTPRKGIVINIAEMRLYYYLPTDDQSSAKVMTHPIGIGKEGWSTPLGYTHIISKVKNPTWTVPASLIREKLAEGIEHPRVVPPGPDNPLGDYAMRLSMPSYLIHGTNQPFGVGRRVSHGCIRLYADSIADLFAHTSIKTSVLIISNPYKTGREGNALYFEAHKPLDAANEEEQEDIKQMLWGLIATLETDKDSTISIIESIGSIANFQDGLPHKLIENFQPSASIRENSWVVQIGAYTNLKVAAQWMERISKLDQPVSMVASTEDGMCHLVVGPFNDRETGLQEREKLEELTGVRGRVQRANRKGMLADCYL